MKHRIMLLAVALAGCREAGPPAPTPDQAEQLNEAETMLNDLAKGEGPEAHAPGPSNSSD